VKPPRFQRFDSGRPDAGQPAVGDPEGADGSRRPRILAYDLPSTGATVPQWDRLLKDASMAEDIDLHMGRRLRRRRLLLGLTQQQVASATGVKFQQVQKYECGANKMSACRLWSLATALEVPVTYFYDGLSGRTDQKPGQFVDSETADVLNRKETTDLVQAYYRLDERPRRHLLDLAKSLRADAATA
jgi:transcriptional regulator with XRE-family HTH domain